MHTAIARKLLKRNKINIGLVVFEDELNLRHSVHFLSELQCIDPLDMKCTRNKFHYTCMYVYIYMYNSFGFHSLSHANFIFHDRKQTNNSWQQTIGAQQLLHLHQFKSCINRGLDLFYIGCKFISQTKWLFLRHV